MKITRVAALLLLVSFAGFFAVHADNGPQSSPAQAAQASESWHKEFDEICSKTQDAMTLSQDDLASLIRRCDALTPQIEKLDESQKKLYLGRLRMCRGVYAYVLDAKQEAGDSDAKKSDKK